MRECCSEVPEKFTPNPIGDFFDLATKSSDTEVNGNPISLSISGELFFPRFIPTSKRYKHETSCFAVHNSSLFVNQHSCGNICKSCHRTLQVSIIYHRSTFTTQIET
ncbi:hypothetical protein NPIL_509101 [Nephila pilipes]|uniref:Uncharacterized protein n=1 Tax=Nephila pilipes TaxID=299642 RepID=A0A8X6N557_NEPPI|nr:hypothetical protein NPIL_509101 [Nephila pilipes]